MKSSAERVKDHDPSLSNLLLSCDTEEVHEVAGVFHLNNTVKMLTLVRSELDGFIMQQFMRNQHLERISFKKFKIDSVSSSIYNLTPYASFFEKGLVPAIDFIECTLSQPVAEGLGKNPRIKQVSLAACQNVTNAMVIAVLKNNNLLRLDLRQSALSGKAIIDAVAKHPSLEHLNIGFNNFTDVDVEPLLTNPNLLSISTPCCDKISDAMKEKLKAHVKNNINRVSRQLFIDQVVAVSQGRKTTTENKDICLLQRLPTDLFPILFRFMALNVLRDNPDLAVAVAQLVFSNIHTKPSLSWDKTVKIGGNIHTVFAKRADNMPHKMIEDRYKQQLALENNSKVRV